MEKYTIIKVKEYDKNSGRVEIKDGVASIVDLVEVERDIQIDNSRSVKKWKPILDALKIEINMKNVENRIFSDVDPYGEENWDEEKCDIEVDPFALFVAVYAEFHSINANFSYGGVFQNYGSLIKSNYMRLQKDIISHMVGAIPEGMHIDPPFPHPGDVEQNLLPVSLKILSQLNIRDKHYEIKNKLPVKEISIKINIDQYEDMRGAIGFDIVQKLESAIIKMLVDQINKELETKNTIYIESLASSLSLIKGEGLYPMFILRSKYEIV